MSCMDLGQGADITVLLAHYRCELWVDRAIESILRQAGVRLQMVFADDASGTPDAIGRLAERWPDARTTWLAASRNAGQFRIYNRLLPYVRSPFVAFQDADDWSEPQRLEMLMEAMEAGGWDLLGSYLESDGRVLAPPADVNRALRWRCRGGVIFGATTLWRTAFLRRIRGFDGSTRFGADTDAAYRAVFAGRVGNLPRVLYHATVRKESLTSLPETGFGSPARRAYRARIRRQFYRNRLRQLAGGLSDEALAPPANDLDFALTVIG
jgi:glycosyltransferase involved in cell wall biosynthesis